MRIGRLIADYRWGNKITVRDLAKTIGIAPATLNRIEHGNACDSNSLAKIMLWAFSKDTGDMP